MARNDVTAPLQLSKATIDRVIKRGELATMREIPGSSHKVRMLIGDAAEDSSDTTADRTDSDSAAKTADLSEDGIHTDGSGVTTVRSERRARERSSATSVNALMTQSGATRNCYGISAQPTEHDCLGQGIPGRGHRHHNPAPELVAFREEPYLIDRKLTALTALKPGNCANQGSRASPHPSIDSGVRP